MKDTAVGLYKRGKIWWISYMVPGLGQRCETTGTLNKRLARKILDTRRAEIVEGRFANLIKSHAPNLKDFCRQYLESRTDLTSSTRKRYECSERKLTTFFGTSELPAITESRIEEYIQSELKAGLHSAG